MLFTRAGVFADRVSFIVETRLPNKLYWRISESNFDIFLYYFTVILLMFVRFRQHECTKSRILCSIRYIYRRFFTFGATFLMKINSFKISLHDKLDKPVQINNQATTSEYRQQQRIWRPNMSFEDELTLTYISYHIIYI